MNEKQLIEIFDATGARLTGHFLLTSGRHSGEYMQCAKLFVQPKVSEQLCGALAKQIKSEKIDCILTPAIGGILMGYEMARQIGRANYFAERVEGEFALRRGFELPEGARVLVAEDVVTTGGSVVEVIQLAKSLGAEVIGVCAIVDRSGGKVDFGVPFFSLWQTNIATYDKEDCPICRAGGTAAIKPGSRT